MKSSSCGNLSYEHIHNFSFMFCLRLLFCFRVEYGIFIVLSVIEIIMIVIPESSKNSA
nr:MAG TPA: hypothetical protein [Caudoviricetes sp.]